MGRNVQVKKEYEIHFTWWCRDLKTWVEYGNTVLVETKDFNSPLSKKRINRAIKALLKDMKKTTGGMYK